MGLSLQRAKWDRPGAEGVPQSLFLELGSWGDFLAQTLPENLPSGLWCDCASSKKRSFAGNDGSLFSPLSLSSGHSWLSKG